MIPIITIQGATASGKSRLAIELAEWLNTEIISVDSRQVYRYMDIGTAKPSKEEQNLIKHHLIDIINPNERYNAGLFIKEAHLVIEDIHKQGKIPILCGGTGLYIKSLKEGIFSIPDIPESIRIKLNTELLEKDLESLYHRLQNIDPRSAERIKPQDKQRILRALEVWEATGQRMSEHWEMQHKENQFQSFDLIIECDRSVLYERINSRLDIMVNQGLLEEIKSLFNMGYTKESFGLNTVGYKEFIPFLENQETYENCMGLAKQHSRNYAKRQITWYRNCNFNVALNQSLINISEVKSLLKIWLEEVMRYEYF